jgi:hypothetical protein
VTRVTFSIYENEKRMAASPLTAARRWVRTLVLGGLAWYGGEYNAGNFRTLTA